MLCVSIHVAVAIVLPLTSRPRLPAPTVRCDVRCDAQRAPEPADRPLAAGRATAGRVVLGVLAAAGAAETAALAAEKLGIGPPLAALTALCLPGGGCTAALRGPYSSVGPVPLALLGFAAYATMTSLAAAAALGARASTGTDGGAAPSSSADQALAAGAGAMAGFSLGLMALLALVIQAPCALCLGSAALSGGLLLAVWATPLLPDRTETAVRTGSGALVGLLAAAALWAGTESGMPPEVTSMGAPPPIRSASLTVLLQACGPA